MNYTTQEIAQLIIETVLHDREHHFNAVDLFNQASNIAEKSRDE